MRWRSKCGDFNFMGLCFSCRKSRPISNHNPVNSEKSEYISSSATPLHACGPLDDEARENSSEQVVSTVDACGTDRCQGSATYKKMANPLKGLVSKRKKRYTKDGFNLDLSYITKNLIAMGFPAEKLEGVFRNHISDVIRFLELKHKDHYKIYNLCSERSYDPEKFKNRVSTYAFDDHNPPKIELIGPFCTDVHEWISQNPDNVAAVHCKAGKGRTGVMICCYMLHSRLFTNANDALSFYGQSRTHDKKGVTIPSQRRYVEYYAQIIQYGLEYRPVSLLLKEILLDPLPHLNGIQGNLQFVISDSKEKKYISSLYETRKGLTSLCLPLGQVLPLTGDIKIEFFMKNAIRRKEKLFHFWFNTFFVRDEVKRLSENGNDTPDRTPPERNSRAMSCDEQSRIPPHLMIRQTRTSSLVSLEPDNRSALMLSIDKWNLDVAHKDKQNKIYPANFKVTLFLTRVPKLEGSVSGEALSNNSTVWRGECPQQQTPQQPLGQPQQCRVGQQDTPSGSSEGDQSSSDSSEDDEEEEEEGWDSGESSNVTPNLTAPLISGGLRKPH